MKKILLYLQSLFYIAAGLNHFRKPLSYQQVIPPYLPAHATLVFVSGITEIILGVLLLLNTSRRFAAYGIVLMLLIFLPMHIYYVQEHSCLPGLCFPEWVGWVRLIIFQPLLIAWAWWYRK